MTEKGKNIRGIIYFLVASLSFLQADSTFRESVPPLLITAIGALTAGLIAWRAYIDKSNSELPPGEVAPPVPVEVKNDSTNPVPTEEADGGTQ